jgi:hypothetical protein
LLLEMNRRTVTTATRDNKIHNTVMKRGRDMRRAKSSLRVACAGATTCEVKMYYLNSNPIRNEIQQLCIYNIQYACKLLIHRTKYM